MTRFNACSTAFVVSAPCTPHVLSRVKVNSGTLLFLQTPRTRSRRKSILDTRLEMALDEQGENDNEPKDEEFFLKKDLSRLDSLEDLLSELQGGEIGGVDDDLDQEALFELFESLPEDVDDDVLAEIERSGGISAFTNGEDEPKVLQRKESSIVKENAPSPIPTDSLENALLQGVVPADAGVGSGVLVGDYGFDPLNLASNDIIGKVQRWIWNRLPGAEEQGLDDPNEERPLALVLRDLREAEIRHGRLAMLAATIWPLQEMLDRLLLEDYQFGSTTIVYGGVTLPYFSLVMTAIMLLLGYLDIYANTVKDVDSVGEAFLPGDCFWDPLSMLEGAPARMKRNMQERELLNGRMAMLAFAVFVFEEATTHRPLITVPGNELLFEPAYQIPYIQERLDAIFASPSPTFTLPEVGPDNFMEVAKDVVWEENNGGLD